MGHIRLTVFLLRCPYIFDDFWASGSWMGHIWLSVFFEMSLANQWFLRDWGFDGGWSERVRMDLLLTVFCLDVLSNSMNFEHLGSGPITFGQPYFLACPYQFNDLWASGNWMGHIWLTIFVEMSLAIQWILRHWGFDGVWSEHVRMDLLLAVFLEMSLAIQ